MRKIHFLLIIGFFLIFLTGCTPDSNVTTNGLTGIPGIPGIIACFKIENDVYFDLTRQDYKPGVSVRYVRIFANALIPAYKVGSSTKMIKPIGQEPLPLNEIHSYTKAGNWELKPMDPFLLVKLRVETTPQESLIKGQVNFDIYVDEAKKNELPDFVKNCKPKGGNTALVMSQPGLPQAQIPNSFFSKSDINPFGFEENYNSISNQLMNYYVKVDSVSEKASDSIQIGRINMSSNTETKTYEVFYHLGTVYLIDRDKTFQYDGIDEIPQSPGESGAKTLKLGTIVFVVLNQWNWYTPECKPVIYFYPQKETLLSLWLYPKGYLTKTEPEYESGWLNLFLNPSGTIFYKGKFYPYLHYEAMIGDFIPPKTGFVVKKENLSSFFDQLLPKLGLNEKETRDFKKYWLSKLTNYPYFQISLLNQKEIEEIEPIEFSQKPETFLRVRFYFKGLESPIILNPPEIKGLIQRLGFTVVEWGGLYE